MKLLFISEHNDFRCRMAAGFALGRHAKGIEVACGNVEPERQHSLERRVMGEVGIDISTIPSVAPPDWSAQSFDVAVVIFSETRPVLPAIPGNPLLIDWKAPCAPNSSASMELKRATLSECRERLRALVDEFMDYGCVTALVAAHRNLATILDNMPNGVIVHNLEGRILFFNEAASRLTGYAAEEALHRVCHDVFPGGLCGAQCSVVNGRIASVEESRRVLNLTTKFGDARKVEMHVRPLIDCAGATVGAIGALREVVPPPCVIARSVADGAFAGMIGSHPRMIEVFDLIRDLADTHVPVLIHGESGTGKELVAAAIHNVGPRAGKRFVPVNCGALSETLLESELFGHERGAFTGAVRAKKGRFELADGGTIFLDEIGDISPAMQVKLLRVVQEGTFERVGGEHSLHVDARVISATHRNLFEAIREGWFREDLYYRLNVIPIFLPPLRERPSDIPLLAEHILDGALAESGRSDTTFSLEAITALMAHDWPGNIRELQNWIRFALVTSKGGVIRPEHFPNLSQWPPRPKQSNPVDTGSASPFAALSLPVVQEAIRYAKGNRTLAARLLGVSRATLYRFLAEHPIA